MLNQQQRFSSLLNQGIMNPVFNTFLVTGFHVRYVDWASQPSVTVRGVGHDADHGGDPAHVPSNGAGQNTAQNAIPTHLSVRGQGLAQDVPQGVFNPHVVLPPHGVQADVLAGMPRADLMALLMLDMSEFFSFLLIKAF